MEDRRFFIAFKASSFSGNIECHSLLLKCLWNSGSLWRCPVWRRNHRSQSAVLSIQFSSASYLCKCSSFLTSTNRIDYLLSMVPLWCLTRGCQRLKQVVRSCAAHVRSFERLQKSHEYEYLVLDSDEQLGKIHVCRKCKMLCR